MLHPVSLKGGHYEDAMGCVFGDTLFSGIKFVSNYQDLPHAFGSGSFIDLLVAYPRWFGSLSDFCHSQRDYSLHRFKLRGDSDECLVSDSLLPIQEAKMKWLRILLEIVSVLIIFWLIVKGGAK